MVVVVVVVVSGKALFQVHLCVLCVCVMVCMCVLFVCVVVCVCVCLKKTLAPVFPHSVKKSFLLKWKSV